MSINTENARRALQDARTAIMLEVGDNGTTGLPEDNPQLEAIQKKINEVEVMIKEYA